MYGLSMSLCYYVKHRVWSRGWQTDPMPKFIGESPGQN